MTTPHCCFIPCDKNAQWDIINGPTPDDHTQACCDHVGHMLDPKKAASVTAIQTSNEVLAMNEQAIFERLRSVIEFAYPGSQATWIESPDGSDDVLIKVKMPCEFNEAKDTHLSELAAEVDLETGVAVTVMTCYQGETP